MASPPTQQPALDVVVEGFTDLRVVGMLLGALDFGYGGAWPGIKEAQRFTRADQAVRVYKAGGISKFAPWVRINRTREPIHPFRFLLLADADDSAEAALAALRTQFASNLPSFTPHHGVWQTVSEPGAPLLMVGVWLAMDTLRQAGSMDTLLRSALSAHYPDFVEAATTFDDSWATLRLAPAGEKTTADHDKAVVGIAQAVLDPKRQYEAAFRDSDIWRAAITNPDGPFRPLLDFLRSALDPSA